MALAFERDTAQEIKRRRQQWRAEKLGKAQLRRLKVYAGDAHPHKAQQPVAIKFSARGEIEVIGR